MLITTTLSPAHGFHPTSTSTIRLSPALDPACLLYLYLSLPPPLFVDTHELTLHAAQYDFQHWGTKDLEKPVHALPAAPARSELLVSVRDWTAAAHSGSLLPVDVPMHLRYGTPNQGDDDDDDEKEVHVDHPAAFFLCPPTTSSVLVAPIIS